MLLKSGLSSAAVAGTRPEIWLPRISAAVWLPASSQGAICFMRSCRRHYGGRPGSALRMMSKAEPLLLPSPCRWQLSGSLAACFDRCTALFVSRACRCRCKVRRRFVTVGTAKSRAHLQSLCNRRSCVATAWRSVWRAARLVEEPSGNVVYRAAYRARRALCA